MKFTIGLPIIKSLFLEETLDGIAKQTFKDFELIIRNNAETQAQKEEIKKICMPWLTSPNVTYLESEVQVPIAENFNEIVKVAKGAYFTVLSDDDVMHPDFLEAFNELTEAFPQVKVFHCRIRTIDEHSSVTEYGWVGPRFETLPEFLFHHLSGTRGTNLSNFVVNTAALQRIGGFTHAVEYDLDSLTWLMLADQGVGFSDKVLLDYRENRFNNTNNLHKLLKRLQDIDIFKSKVEDIIQSTAFREASIYPADYLQEKNAEAFARKAKSVIYTVYKKTNIFTFCLFFLKNRKKNYFPAKLFAKYIAMKLVGLK